MLNLCCNNKLIKNYFLKNNFFDYKITLSRRNISSSASRFFTGNVWECGNYIAINKKYWNCNVSFKVRNYFSAPHIKTLIDLNELEHLSQNFFDRYSDRINMKTFYAKLQKKYITKIYFFDSAINFGGKTFFVKYSSVLLKNINSQFFINIWESTNAEKDNKKLIGLNLNSKIQNSFFKKWIFYFNSFFKTKEPFLVSFCRKQVKRKKKWKVYLKKRKKLILFTNYIRFLSNINQVKYFRTLFSEIFFTKNFFYEKRVISGNFLLFFDNNFKNISNFLSNFLLNYILFEKYLLFFISQKNLFFLFNGKGKNQTNYIVPKFKPISLISYKNLEMFFDSYNSSLILDEQNEKTWFNFFSGKLEMMDNQLFNNNKIKNYNFFWKYKKKKRTNLLHFKSAFVPNRRFFWKSNVSLFFSNFAFSELRSLPLHIKKFSSKFLKKGLNYENKKKKAIFIKGRNFVINFFNNKFFNEKLKQKFSILNFLAYSLSLRSTLKNTKLFRTFRFINGALQCNPNMKNIYESSSKQLKIKKKKIFMLKDPFRYFYLRKYNHQAFHKTASSNLFSAILLSNKSSSRKNNFLKSSLPVFKFRIFGKLKKNYFRKFFEIGTRVFTLFKRRFIKFKFYKPLISFLGNLKKKWFFLYKNLKIMLMNFFCKKENDKYFFFGFSLKTIYFYILFIGLHFFFKFSNFISFFNSLKVKIVDNLEQKNAYVTKIFSCIKFIKKKLFNFSEQMRNTIILRKNVSIPLKNFFFKSSSILFYQTFSFVNYENRKQYLDFLKNKISSFLISPHIMLLFNYKYNGAVFFDDIKSGSPVNLFDSIKQMLAKNYNLAFLKQVPKGLFSQASKYIKKFNYFHTRKILDKKKKIKRKKKRLKLFLNRKFNKNRKNKFLKFTKKKIQKKRIISKKEGISFQSYKKIINIKNPSKKKIPLNFLRKKNLIRRKFLKKLLKLNKIKNKTKKFRLKKLFFFFLTLKWKKKEKGKSGKLLSWRHKREYGKKIKSKNLYKVKVKFRNIKKAKAVTLRKRVGRLFVLNRLHSFNKSFDYNYRMTKMLYFSLKAEFRDGLLNLKNLFGARKKEKFNRNKYILKNEGIVHKVEPKIIMESSLKKYLLIFLKIFKLFPFFNDSFSEKSKITSINNFYFFVLNNPYINYLKNNIRIFCKADPFLVKYVSFFKNTFSNFLFTNNSKNLKQYFTKRYMIMRKIKIQKKKIIKSSNTNKFLEKFLNLTRNRTNKKKKIIFKKRDTLQIIRKFFKKIKRIVFSRIKKYSYRYKKFIFKKVSKNKNFNLLAKLKNLNKNYVLKRKFRQIELKSIFVGNILVSLLDVKFLNFENAFGILQLFKSFQFLGFTKDSVLNEFLIFSNSNKGGNFEDIAFENNKSFFKNLGVLFNDIVFKLYMLDKNKVKIDWIMLNKIFLNFFINLRSKLLNDYKKIIPNFNKNLETLLIFFLFKALSFIFSVFLQNKPLSSFPANINFYPFTILKEYQFNKFFEYFPQMWDFFIKNFPFHLIIVSRKNFNKNQLLVSNSKKIKSENSSVFLLNKTILKFYDYSKFIFNKMKENVIHTKDKVINIFVENFIKNNYKNFFFLIIKASKNNIFFTFLNRKGRLVKKGSGGMLGYEGPKRTTYLAASENIKNIVSNIILKYKIRKKYKYKHKFTQKYSNIRKRKITTKSEKKRQIFLSIIKSFFFNVVIILKSTSKNMQVKAVLESLYSSGCKIVRILNYAARSHNGCRKKKVRRL